MAYYSEDLIEEVISQNDIVDVISEYVTLKKSGRNFMGLCPFHREKTPSFCVSMDKQIYKCFGCSEGGNVISFVMKLENLEFWETVEYLAERSHIDLSKYEVKSFKISNQKQEVSRDLKEALFRLNRDVGLYYHNNLIELLNEKESKVKEYIIKRKLDIKTIKRFGIGFATGKTPLYEHLVSLGYSKTEIFASGIILQNEKGRIYDRFFSRLMFPIFDVRDRIIAFGGRVLDNSLPKYVNSPENEIYYKGKNLYALNLAKKEKLENIIMVEGYMDAIALHKSGINNVVASLGTALTDNQARLLKKYTDTVIIGYDQDGAGQDATLRGLDILVSKNINVKVLVLDKPDAKDPDEYINKYGVERYNNCIKNSISLIEFKISRLEKNLDLNNIDSKIKFLTQISEILATIPNNIEREIYISKIASKYDISEGPILKEVEKRLGKKESQELQVDMQSLSRKMQLVTNIRKRQEQFVISLILSKDKQIQNEIFEKISIEDIDNQEVKNIYKFILNLKEEYDLSKVDILSKVKDENMMKELTEIMYIDIGQDRKKLLLEVLKNKKKEKILSRREEILKRIGENISQDEQEILKIELNQLILELSKLK